VSTEKILVTGCAGFIGANLTTRLVEEGYRIVGVDNLSYGSRDNMSAFIGNANFEFIRADIRDVDAMERAVQGVTQIVHLAAYKIPRYSDALDTLLINGMGSHCVLELAHKYRIRIIAASTADIYGKNPDVPFNEDSNIVLGSSKVRRWAYAVSKLYEEHLLLAYHERYHVPVVILRFFGGYGPHMNLSWWGGPIAVFLKSAINRTPIPVHGDGSQTRSFTFVSDYVDPIVKLLARPEIDGEILNIGSTHEVTIKELAETAWRTVQKDDPQIELIPYESFGRYEDCKRRQPDITRAAELLDYEPQITLHDGLHKTLEWVALHMAAEPTESDAKIRRRQTRIFFLVPVYNEADNIRRLIHQLTGAADTMENALVHFVFVNDGSTDATREVLDEMAPLHPITTLDHASNSGVGAAFNTGFDHLAKQCDPDDIIVTLEGDNTSDPEVLHEMIEALKTGADVALASCYHHRGGIANVTMLRLLLSHGANGLCKTVFGLNAIATLSSFYRAYRAKSILKVQKVYGSPIMTSKGFECMVELLAKLNYCDQIIEEIPMLLDGSKRAGKSKMRIIPTVMGYFRLIGKKFFTRSMKRPKK
jgi:UDP-glucose 4-epimerase